MLMMLSPLMGNNSCGLVGAVVANVRLSSVEVVALPAVSVTVTSIRTPEPCNDCSCAGVRLIDQLAPARVTA